MHHKRDEVIKRTEREFEQLDQLVANLSASEWLLRLRRPETKDPWTVKDALAHITHWKADTARKARRLPVPAEERGLDTNASNHLVYLRWKDHSPQDVLNWHKQVQADLLAALRDAPDDWFSEKDRNAQWPYDLDGHSAYHRIKDIAKAVKSGSED